MALAKTAYTCATSVAVWAGTEYSPASCAGYDASTVIAADAQAVVTYNASATCAGVCRVYGSDDGTNYSSDPFDQFTLPFAANTTKRGNKPIIPAPKYIKVTVYNPDGVYHLTAVTTKVTFQTA